MEILSVVGRNVNSFYFIIIIYLDERESKVYDVRRRRNRDSFIFPSFSSAIPYVVGCSGQREREEERKSCKFLFLHNFKIFTSCRERTL